jgi:hypothetical protein
MPGRYDKTADFSFDVAGGLAPKKRAPVKRDPFEDMLRLAGNAAPMVGMGIGGLAAGLSSGGMGAPAGAGIGGAIGSAIGGGLNYGADMAGEDEAAEHERRRREDEERAAQNNAALSMIRGLG